MGVNNLKYCGKCDTFCEKSKFGKNKCKKDGLQSICKTCRNNYEKLWLINNRELHLKRARNSKQKNISINKKNMQIFLIGKVCVDCGNNDIRVFEFDHRCDKKGNVSDMMSRYKWETVLLEINKCDIVCANCHRIRTVERRKILN